MHTPIIYHLHMQTHIRHFISACMCVPHLCMYFICMYVISVCVLDRRGRRWRRSCEEKKRKTKRFNLSSTKPTPHPNRFTSTDPPPNPRSLCVCVRLVMDPFSVLSTHRSGLKLHPPIHASSLWSSFSSIHLCSEVCPSHLFLHP